MKRIDDLPVYNSKLNLLLKYPLFDFEDSETTLSYYFFSNHNPESKLFPSLKTTDYFLLVNGRINENRKTELINNIKKTTNVLTAFKVDLNKIKGLNNFLSDLELHLLESAATKKK
ncbi:MAG: hypothetical protein B6D61_11180 [Bacteroidetes bacterium 4484_249]|nr:MAG: hypothetical protein B6D61_11180 [Bacteroidetes bacterium 4484_249]